MLLIAFGIFAIFGRIEAHNRPIIGILTQEISKTFEHLYPGQYDSYISASYVKFIEASGARVIPIWNGKSAEYYKPIMSKINGVLLPGGTVDKAKPGGYAMAAEIIFDIANEYNRKGDFFPIWGVGLGMDMMLYLSANKTIATVDCKANYITTSLIFTKGN